MLLAFRYSNMLERVRFFVFFLKWKVCFYHLENPFKWPAAAAGKTAVPERAKMLEVRFEANVCKGLEQAP